MHATETVESAECGTRCGITASRWRFGYAGGDCYDSGSFCLRNPSVQVDVMHRGSLPPPLCCNARLFILTTSFRGTHRSHIPRTHTSSWCHRFLGTSLSLWLTALVGPHYLGSLTQILVNVLNCLHPPDRMTSNRQAVLKLDFIIVGGGTDCYLETYTVAHMLKVALSRLLLRLPRHRWISHSTRSRIIWASRPCL